MRDQDEEHSNKTGTRTKRFRCPIYMPRSEENLLKSKGVELVELLGEGSYSKVYLCKKKDQQQEMRGGAPVSYVLALKIVDSNKTSAEYTKKFLPRELSVLMKIRHPNIIRLYMLLQRKSKFYILMRYAERGDLLEYILGNGLITENRARFWTYQIATAIEYLHTMNVVHRDIKTENILITECFNVKLTDFGFSRFIGHEELSSTYCGSISYSPPEILELKPHDAKKSDMWSFGVVIFVMLIKRLPFRESENPKDLLAEQLQKSYIMPPKMEEVLSLPSKKALKHLLQPNPAKRWDIKELLGSQWIAMDFRLVVRNQKEREALCEAVEIAANRGGRIWNEMVEDHGKIIGEAMENITRKGKRAVDMWRSTDRKIITYLEDKENMSNYVIDRLTSLKRQENDIEPFIVKSITDKDRKTEREEYYKRKSKLENIRWEQKEAAEWNKYYRRMVKEDREYVLDVQPLEDRTRRKITMMDSGQDEIIKKLLEYQQRKTQKQIKRHENRKKWLTLLSRKMKHRENSLTQMKMKSESNIGKEKQEKWKWWKTTRFRKCKNKKTKTSLQNELTNMKTDDSQNSQTSQISDNSNK